MAENDWAGWEELTRKLGEKVQLVGDDIFVTNTASCCAKESIVAWRIRY